MTHPAWARLDQVSDAVLLKLTTVNADRGSLSDRHQHCCHEGNDGDGKWHPFHKHHFLPLCVIVPALRPCAP